MLPAGIITIWFGAIVDIPDGWALCDGTAGTPDLTDRFIEGAGGALNPGDTGGNANHDHTFTSDGHTHTLPAGANLAAGPAFSSTTGSSFAIGTTDNSSSLPPFYALAYIMKL